MKTVSVKAHSPQSNKVSTVLFCHSTLLWFICCIHWKIKKLMCCTFKVNLFYRFATRIIIIDVSIDEWEIKVDLIMYFILISDMFGNGHWIMIRTLGSLFVVCTLPRQNRILCTYWSETENSRYIMNLQSFTFFFWNQFFLCMKVPILIINNRDILTCTTMSTFWTVNVCILPLSSQPYRSMWWTTLEFFITGFVAMRW